MSRLELVPFGRTLKPHGLKGAIRIRLGQGIIPLIAKDEPVFIHLDGGPVPFFVEEWADAPGSDINLRLEGISTIDAAERLCGKEVLAEPRLIRYEEEDSLLALVGYEVHDLQRGPTGRVSGIMDNSHQAVLEIAFEGKEILIPAAEGIIVGVDAEARRLTIDAPDGLIDLYLNA